MGDCPEPCEPCETYKKETSLKEEESYKITNPGALRDFAKELHKLFSQENPMEEAYVKFLKIEKTKRRSITNGYPPYLRNLALYSINKWIEQFKGKVTNYMEGVESPVLYEEIQTGKNIHDLLIQKGTVFFYYKEKPFILSIDFRWDFTEVSFVYDSKDNALGRETQENFRKFMAEHNFYKGAKLEYLQRGFLKILDFPKLALEDVILPTEIKEEIDLNIIFPIKNKEKISKMALPWRRGVILSGVPGVGKTQLGKVLCNVLDGVTILWTTTKAINCSEEVRRIFEAARYFSPSLMILEDIDFIGTDRELIHDPVLGELLSQLDGATPNDGVFVIATTNRPQLLDRALADRPSRFDASIYLELPKIDERRRLFQLFLKGKPYTFDVEDMCRKTEGFTGAHIQELIIRAGLMTLKRDEEVLSPEIVEESFKKIKKKAKTLSE